MIEELDIALADLTTLGVGGNARRMVTVDNDDDLIAAVRASDDRRERVLILGGGSNLVCSDTTFDGTVVRIATRGITVTDNSECAGVTVRIAAGEPWDDVVQRAVAEGWVGIEALSGIPGLTGATPVQNVGAYGQEIADVVATVRTYDRGTKSIRTFAASDCHFGYRTSRFKHDVQWVVLEVELQLPSGQFSAPVKYAELAKTLGVEVGGRASLTEVREAVLDLRRGKGMVVDPADPDSRSAGSFFTNPLLDQTVADQLPADAPRWPQPDGTVKTSAAWLIERAGFTKGYGTGPVGLSSKHSLALINRGDAKASDVIALASAIRDTVEVKYGVELHAEPTMWGTSLNAVPSQLEHRSPAIREITRKIEVWKASARAAIFVAFAATFANFVVSSGQSKTSGLARLTAAAALGSIAVAIGCVIAGFRGRRRLRALRRNEIRPNG